MAYVAFEWWHRYLLRRVYVNITGVPYTLLKTFLWSIFAPWQRLKNTFRGETLKEKLNRAIKSRFYYFNDVGSEVRNGQEIENIIGDNVNNTRNKDVNVENADKKNAKRRHDSNLKIIHWSPNVTYRADYHSYQTNNKGKTRNKDKLDYDSEEIDDIMNEFTPRSVTTRAGRNKMNKMKSDFKFEPMVKSKNFEKDHDGERNIEKARSITKEYKKEKSFKLNDDLSDTSEMKFKKTNTARTRTLKYVKKRPLPKVDFHSDDSEREVTVTSSVSKVKRHHKRHHNKRRRKHKSKSHTLKKIMKIIKYLRSHHKKDKHRKHHHKFSKIWRKFQGADIGDSPTKKLTGKEPYNKESEDKDEDIVESPTMKLSGKEIFAIEFQNKEEDIFESLTKNLTDEDSYDKQSQNSYEKEDSEEYAKVDVKNDRLRYEMGKTSLIRSSTKSYPIPMQRFYNFVKQPYDKNDLSFRRSFDVHNKMKDKVDKIKVLKLREDSLGSDEEIILKMNLLKAMTGKEELDTIHSHKSMKGLLESSYSVDDEALLKSRLYKYLKTE